MWFVWDKGHLIFVGLHVCNVLWTQPIGFWFHVAHMTYTGFWKFLFKMQKKKKMFLEFQPFKISMLDKQCSWFFTKAWGVVNLKPKTEWIGFKNRQGLVPTTKKNILQIWKKKVLKPGWTSNYSLPTPFPTSINKTSVQSRIYCYSLN